jgi:hypothetical protein
MRLKVEVENKCDILSNYVNYRQNMFISKNTDYIDLERRQTINCALVPPIILTKMCASNMLAVHNVMRTFYAI